jgi:hypothetical protein
MKRMLPIVAGKCLWHHGRCDRFMNQSCTITAAADLVAV